MKQAYHNHILTATTMAMKRTPPTLEPAMTATELSLAAGDVTSMIKKVNYIMSQ